MNIELIRLTAEYKEQLFDMLTEWKNDIRPSERGKDYATAMISPALDECRKLGIDRVLMTCDKDNIASARSIIKNGGVLENEIEDNGHIIQRYRIQL